MTVPVTSPRLGMIEIESYIAALKITWVRRHLTSDHIWTTLFDREISSGRFLWNRNSQSLTKFARTVGNTFWKETILAFANFTSALTIDEMDGGRCSLWYSNETKFKDEEIVQWKNRGLHNVNDVLKEPGVFLTLRELKERYGVTATPLDLQGITQSLSKHFGTQVRLKKHPEPVIHPFLSSVLEKKRGAKQFYQILIDSKYRGSKNIWEEQWESEFGEIDWKEAYKVIFESTTSIKLQMLNYKIVTKIAVTNRLLFHIGISEHDRCPRCTRVKDSISHKFWECDQVRRFWVEVGKSLSKPNGTSLIVLDKKMVILGVGVGSFISHIIALGKSIINENGDLSIGNLKARISLDKKTEEIVARRNEKLAEFSEKWAGIVGTGFSSAPSPLCLRRLGETDDCGLSVVYEMTQR